MTRRSFLKSVLRVSLVLGGLKFSSRRLFAFVNQYDPQKHFWNMAIDIEKCIGCGRCVEACKTENNVPNEPFYFRTWIERYLVKANGKVVIESPDGGLKGFPEPEGDEIVKGFFVPKMCNHCDKSPCIQVCPVGASYKTGDGVVMVDKNYCIGCRYCIQACPYGSRYFNPETKTPDKCTFCYHRITKGLKPACVEACPTGARIFGDMKDKTSEITKFINSHKVTVLKPDMGTHPKVCYNGFDRVIR